MEVQGEIIYQKEDRTWVHSDIEPKGCQAEGLTNPKYKEYIHKVLDEWLEMSRGTGCFYIKQLNFKVED